MATIDINFLTTLAKEAGKMIMVHYHGNTEIYEKSDQSPVTDADLEANFFIVEALKKAYPDIPAVAEENTKEENDLAKKSPTHWLIDPLDGTKSFINKTDQFTVNIALIENHKPIFGVVYIPAQNVCYFTGEDGLAYKEAQGEVTQIAVREIPKTGAVVIASHSHRDEKTDAFIEALPHVDRCISAASSLKFCLVAEGKADIYPRFGPTMQWDIAAGHAVVTAAGGKVTFEDSTVFSYESEKLLNPAFIVSA